MRFCRWLVSRRQSRNVPSQCSLESNRVLLHYPLRRRTIMNVLGVSREPSWQEEGWRIPGKIEEFVHLYSDLYPDALQLIRTISPGSLFKWGLRDREPLRKYTKARVTMLGDAADPMSPFLGQGACIAIEDAMILGRGVSVTACASFPGAQPRLDGAGAAGRSKHCTA